MKITLKQLREWAELNNGPHSLLGFKIATIYSKAKTMNITNLEEKVRLQREYYEECENASDTERDALANQIMRIQDERGEA